MMAPPARVTCGGIGPNATMYVYDVTSLRARYSTRCGKNMPPASDKVAPVMPRLGTDSCKLGAAPVRCDDLSPHWCVTVIMRGWEAVLDGTHDLYTHTNGQSPHSLIRLVLGFVLGPDKDDRLPSSAYSTTLPTCLVTVCSTRDRVPVSNQPSRPRDYFPSLAWSHVASLDYEPVYSADSLFTLIRPGGSLFRISSSSSYLIFIRYFRTPAP